MLLAWETFISQHSIFIQVHDYKGLETRELEVELIVAVVEYDNNRERRRGRSVGIVFLL